MAFQTEACQATKGFSKTIQGGFRGEKNQLQHLAARPSVNIDVNYTASAGNDIYKQNQS
jgi:hypothetical protein